jgi:hypothetical protein
MKADQPPRPFSVLPPNQSGDTFAKTARTMHRSANSIPNARFELVTEACHFPQIERLDAILHWSNDSVVRLTAIGPNT